MKRVVLIFGFIAGAIVSLMMVLSLAFAPSVVSGNANSLIFGYATMVLAFLMVFFGIRSYRDNVGGGSISFGRAFAVGTCITLITCVCYSTTWEIAYRSFAPDFYSKYAVQAVDRARAAGASPAQLEAKTHEMEQMNEMSRNPLMSFAMTFIEPLPVGLLITLISAAVLRKKRSSSGGRSSIEGAMPTS